MQTWTRSIPHVCIEESAYLLPNDNDYGPYVRINDLYGIPRTLLRQRTRMSKIGLTSS